MTKRTSGSRITPDLMDRLLTALLWPATFGGFALIVLVVIGVLTVKH
jgi:hypothetical protein